MHILEVYENYLKVEMKSKRKQTYDTKLRIIMRWMSFSDQHDVEDVTRARLIQFGQWLKDQFGIGPASINTHIDTIRQVCKCAFDNELTTKAAPSFPRLTESATVLKHYLSNKELNRLYKACKHAVWPTTVDPVWHWRAALVMFYTYGMRTQELIAYRHDMTPLTWANIFKQKRTPARDGKAKCKYGWLQYLPQKQSHIKPEPLSLPVNEMVLFHLNKIRRDEGRVIPFPKSSHQFYTQWRELQRIAKVCISEGEYYDVKHLRKTAATKYASIAGSEVSESITGHAKRGVSATHYRNIEVQVRDAVLALDYWKAAEKELAA